MYITLGNLTIFDSIMYSVILVPKITEIGQLNLLLKLSLVVGWYTYEAHCI